MITWYVMTVAHNGLHFPQSKKIGGVLARAYQTMIEKGQGFSYETDQGTVSIPSGVVNRSIFLFTEVSE